MISGNHSRLSLTAEYWSVNRFKSESSANVLTKNSLLSQVHCLQMGCGPPYKPKLYMTSMDKSQSETFVPTEMCSTTPLMTPQSNTSWVFYYYFVLFSIISEASVITLIFYTFSTWAPHKPLFLYSITMLLKLWYVFRWWASSPL